MAFARFLIKKRVLTTKNNNMDILRYFIFYTSRVYNNT